MSVPIKYQPVKVPRWAFMQWYDIPTAYDIKYVYLRRLRIIATPLFGINLHLLFEPDEDQDPHDHPWNFISWIIKGGYTEAVYNYRNSNCVMQYYRHRFSFHRMPTVFAHKITNLHPGTVTLVLIGRRQREWGFWTPDGWVIWKTYVQRKYGNAHPQVNEFS